jgi:plasmid stabilization system protein ParE
VAASGAEDRPVKVRIAARAKADIEQNTLHIATDNPGAARRWFVEIQR